MIVSSGCHAISWTSLKRLLPCHLQCTKNKTWKDIAAQLGIGASSSGAYTLKKHYGKNLLPFECQFDRGGIDPGPLLQQVGMRSGFFRGKSSIQNRKSRFSE